MEWFEALEERELSIRKQLEHDHRANIFEPIDLETFMQDIEMYASALDSHCSGMNRNEETAFRYAVRLKLPLLHHLQGLSQTQKPKKTA